MQLCLPGDRLRIVSESGRQSFGTSDWVVDVYYTLGSRWAKRPSRVRRSLTPCCGRFWQNGLLPVPHWKEVNLYGDRLLGAGVEAFYIQLQ